MSEAQGVAAPAAAESAQEATEAKAPANIEETIAKVEAEESEKVAAPKQKEEPKKEATAEKKTEKARKILADQDLDSVVKIKVNGEEQEMTVREALKLTQLEKVSRDKLTQADQMMKQVQQVINFAKANPKEFLKETGLDPYEFAEATLLEKYELMQMTPEQKELLQLKQWKALKDEEEKQVKAKSEQEALSKAEIEETQKLDQEIGNAWKESGLPAHPYFGAQIAFQMMAASKAGKELTAKDAAVKVNGEFRNNIKGIFGSLDAEAIHELFGEDFFKKLRKYDLDKISAKAASKLGTTKDQQGLGQKPTSLKNQSKYGLSELEWRKQMDDKLSAYTD